MPQELGLSIVDAADGREAVVKALELLPDLVLMDIQMPLMNGLEATKVLREKCSKTPPHHCVDRDGHGR